MRTLQRKIHAIAATASFLLIAAFWISTVVAELFLSAESVVAVKQSIAYALLILIPSIAVAGGTGFSMGGKSTHSLIVSKRRRMPVIALTGFLVLMPAAIYLNLKAQAGEFDSFFYMVQTLELLAGASNLTLIGLNMRDGLRLTRHRRPRPIAP